MDSPPHPNAQKLFVNWWLSKEGQTIFQGVTGSQSLRTDIGTEGIGPRELREPGQRYFLLERDANFQDQLDKVLAFVTEVLG